MIVLIALIVTFLALSGLMAAVDAAVLSVTLPEVHELISKGKRGARALAAVKGELARAVVVIVVLTNTINILGPIVVSQQAVAHYGVGVLAVITAVLTIGTILFSEIIPKAVGAHYAPSISRIASPVIRVLQWSLFPLVVALERLSLLFTSGTRRIGTEQQIRSLTTIGRRAGYIEHDEGLLIHRAFILNDKTAAAIMTPLRDVVSVNASMTVGEAAAEVRRSVFSRFPVFGESTDQVEGSVMIRDILEAVADDRSDESIRAITRPAFTVSAACRSDALLLRFRDRHVHLAIVRDHRRTVGVVTLEDVLEELVGEIEDERDVEKLSL